MKFRNSWKNRKPNWGIVNVRFRLSLIDVFSVEIDPKREFYSITVLNFTIKNR
jgi:hypothetical protein